MPDGSQYKTAALTTDVVLFRFFDNEVQVLLIERRNPPFQGKWAFPGGFLDYGEPPEVGALRELQEETGITNVVIEQLGAYGDPARDPRGHTVSIVFLGFADVAHSNAKGADDAAEARWFNITRIPELAFDHPLIIAAAIQSLHHKFRHGAEVLGLLPEGLTVSDLKSIYNTLAQAKSDVRVT